ncbi:MAG: FAD-binding protein [Acidobacteria bacterium]|nr:FAD-binding protein [Acidobacteriota bacterium]
MSLAVSSVGELQDGILAGRRLLARGGGTKTGLSSDLPGFEIADLRRLSGVVEHQPSEFTITALAGTRLSKLEEILAAQGQYLPFDPILVARGSTVGGAVASGVAGSGRLRYGGVRDFVLAVAIVDGRGRLVRGGGRVVKNAAGFDLPKLMVGSVGALGILTEVCFKVFPRSSSMVTVRADYDSLEEAVAALVVLRGGPYELDALDLDGSFSLWARIAGLEKALAGRAERVRSILGRGETVDAAVAVEHWSMVRELGWLRDETFLVKVPLTPPRILDLDRRVEGLSSTRYYSAGGQQAWLALTSPKDLTSLDRVLSDAGLRGLVVLGDGGPVLLGVSRDRELVERLRRALDPRGLFRSVDSLAERTCGTR